MMPEMNGFDVAAVLKNDPATMDIPIIILSILEDKERGFRLGVDRYLTKPIDTASLFHEVDALLDQGKSQKESHGGRRGCFHRSHPHRRSGNARLQVVESNGSELVSRAVALQARHHHSQFPSLQRRSGALPCASRKAWRTSSFLSINDDL